MFDQALNNSSNFLNYCCSKERWGATTYLGWEKKVIIKSSNSLERFQSFPGKHSLERSHFRNHGWMVERINKPWLCSTVSELFGTGAS